MSEQTLNEQLSSLRDLGAAMRIAEREDLKARHGSNLAEYERARRLGEGFAAQFGGQVKAVRDLPDNAGISLVIPYHGKDRLITMTFEELHEAGATDEENEDLYTRWFRTLKSSASIIPEPMIVRGTARKVTKKAPVVSEKRKRTMQTADGVTLEVVDAPEKPKRR